MKICPHCQKVTEDAVNFCPVCGAPMQSFPEEPTYEDTVYMPPQQGYVQPPQYTYTQPPYAQPTYAQPPYTQPSYAQPPKPASPVSKGRVIPGMALGIAGMATAILGLLYTFCYFMIGVANELEEMVLASAIMGFVFIGFSLPLSIVGYTMSSSNRDMGDTSNMSRLGINFGRIGIVLSIVMGGFAFIALIAFSSGL